MSEGKAKVLGPKEGKAGLLGEEVLLRERYSLEMDLESVPVLAERFGLRLPPKR